MRKDSNDSLMAAYASGKIPHSLMPPKRIDGIYHNTKDRINKVTRTYNYWGMTTLPPIMRPMTKKTKLPDYYYSEIREKK